MSQIAESGERVAKYRILQRGALALIVLAGTLAWSAPMHGIELTVGCGNPKARLKTITQALALLPKQGPNTIHISGTCNETVVIDGFDNLTLIANPGASINDPTPSVPDDNDVVDVFNSQRVTIQGFIITGGFDGIACARHSLCFLNGNTVQEASDAGIDLFGGSQATLTGNTIQGNSGDGLAVGDGSEGAVVGGTIQNNGAIGADVFNGSLLALSDDSGGVPATVRANSAEGIVVGGNSTVVLRNHSTVSANGADGVLVVDGAGVRVAGNTQISGNSGNGIQLLALSFASVTGSVDLSGNSGSPVACAGAFSNARGLGANAGLSCQNP